MTDMEMYKKLKIVEKFFIEACDDELVYLDDVDDLFESAYEAIDEVIRELMERGIRKEIRSYYKSEDGERDYDKKH